MGLMRAAFTGSHSRVVTYHKISCFMDDSEIFWIMSGAKKRINFLKNSGVSDDHILNLSKSLKTDLFILHEIEKYSEVSVSYIIQSDRILSRKNKDEAYQYLCRVYSAVRDYLIKNSINIVFSEATWAYELVTCAACTSLGVRFIVPHTVRIPAGRFAFFEGIFQRELIKIPRNEPVSIAASEEPERSSKPQNLLNLHNIKCFIKHFRSLLSGDENDETTQNVFQLVMRNLRCRINAQLSGFSKMPANVSGKYVYFPLHCQPEASVDVLGGFYNNQLELVRAVSKALPAGVSLIVKEHPYGLGCRSYRFFREIEKMPNVINISPWAESGTLIKNAMSVFSVSGTACYEAAVSGVGAVVFTDMFYNALPMVVRCRSYEEIGDCLRRASESVPDHHALQAYMADIINHSYTGCVEPPDVFPDVLKEENARIVGQAFTDVLRYYSSSEVGISIAASISSRCS